MAYVAISNELLTAVREGIRGMARKELDTVGNIPKLKGSEPFVEEALWGQYAHLKAQMPKEWKRTAERLILRIQLPGSGWQEIVTFQNPQEAPPTYSSYEPPKVLVSHEHPDVREIVTIVSNRHDANRRWAAVERQVLEFLGKCKSLNEGLKLWPDLRMYIPKHFLDRVERKVERPKENGTAALDVLKSMDTDQIVAAAVIARMSTGKNEES